jgi:hypothetical protein
MYSSNYRPLGDEAGFAAIGRNWRGPFAAYSYHFVDRPPLLILLCRWLATGFGLRQAYVGFSLAALCSTVLMVVSGVGIARCLGCGRLLLGCTGVLIAAMAAHPQVTSGYVNNELLASGPSAVALALVFLELSRKRRLSAQVTLCAGFCAGLAFSLKQSGLDALLVGLAMLMYGSRRGLVRRGRWKMFVLGSLAPVLPQIAVLGPRKFYWVVFGARATYINAGSTGIGTVASRVGHYLLNFWPSIGALMLLATVGVAMTVRTQTNEPIAHFGVVAWWFVSFGFVVVGGFVWSSNWIGMTVPSCLLAVRGGSAAALWMGATLRDRGNNRRTNSSMRSTTTLGAAALCSLIALSIGNVGVRAVKYTGQTGNFPMDGVVYENSEYAVAAYIRNRTKPDEPVGSFFQASGFNLMVDRPLVGRQLFFAWVPVVPNQLRLVEEDLRTFAPKYILVTEEGGRALLGRPQLSYLLAGRYRQVLKVEYLTVLRRY